MINLIGRLLIYAVGKVFFGKSIKFIIADDIKRNGKISQSIKKHEYGHRN